MTNAVPMVIRIVAAFAIALAGGGLSAFLARTHKQLCALISLGAGTLLGVALCGILPECLNSLSWWQLVLGAVTGYLLFAVVSRYVFHVCPACAASHFDEATTHRLAEFGMAMMLALAIHCTVDGMALAAGREQNASVDWSITLAICVHKLPEGLALGAILMAALGSEWKAMLGATAAQSLMLAGGILAVFLAPHIGLNWTIGFLAVAAGAFVFLGYHAIDSEYQQRGAATAVMPALTGAVGAAALRVVVPGL